MSAPKARIVTRIRRFEFGNLGDVKSIGGSVIEARIDYGPGYRIYLIRHGKQLIVLLGGGDKGPKGGIFVPHSRLPRSSNNDDRDFAVGCPGLPFHS